MLRRQFLVAFVMIGLAISSCGKKSGNGPAVNPESDTTIDLSAAKGLWVVSDDIKEFRQTGRVDSLCLRNPTASVRDSTCVIDAKGGIFYYTEKSWTENSQSLQVGRLDRTGRATFLEIPTWPYDKDLYAEVKIDRDAMIWSYKRNGQGSEVRTASDFTRTTADEIRRFASAQEACQTRQPDSNSEAR